MKYRRHIQIAAVLLILCTGALYATVLHASYYYAGALARANTYEEIRIADSVYIVTQGRVALNENKISGLSAFRPLRLAYKKVQAERSPLLALPGVDPSKLDRALQTLRTEQTFLAKLQTNPTETRLVDTALYPVQFLESASLLEQARQRFITSGDESDAAEYSKLLKETIDAYRHDLSLFGAAFQTLTPPTARTYGTLMNTLDRPSMIRALESLEISIERTGHKALTRELCTYAIVALCGENNLYLPEIATSSSAETASTPLIREVITVYKSAAYPLGNTPVVSLTSSACIPSKMPASFTFFRYGTSTQDAYITPFYAGDIILVNSSRYLSSSFYRYFNDNGVTYVLVDPLTYYECFEALNDFSSSLTNLAISYFARDNDAGRYIATTTAEHIEVLSGRLKGGLIIENDATSYIYTLNDALPATRETKQLHRSLEEFALALSYKTAGLSELVSTISLFESGNRMIAKDGGTFDIGAKNLFYTRSGFGSLFLTTHPDISGSGEPIFPPNELPADSMPYEYFSDLRLVQGLQEVIQSDLGFFRTAHIQK